jgi:type I restriction-modification system DNA methylase subunit
MNQRTNNLAAYIWSLAELLRGDFKQSQYGRIILHLISKLRDSPQGGDRIGIILNRSPLFTGRAGYGESQIRRYILEADLLETIVALPTDMFLSLHRQKPQI